LCPLARGHLAAAASALKRRGGRVVPVPADVSVQAEAERVVDTARQRFGRLDMLVTNARVIHMGPAAAMRTQDFIDAMAVAFLGGVHPTLAALPQMRDLGTGKILVITSSAERSRNHICCPTQRPSTPRSGSPRGCVSKPGGTELP
jgi:NAD(P)-dependent dehydrogenase (short-subunit alcohol dehydrogenase family)